MEVGKKRHRLGFWQVDPMPSQDELEKYYRDVYFQKGVSGTYSQQYTDDERKSFVNRAVVTEHIWKRLKGEEKGSVYDIGCGEGYFIDYFLKNGWTVEACDFSSFGIETQNPQVLPHFTRGDIYEILDGKVKAGRNFDIVNLHGVLEHVREPERLLEAMKGVMHKGSLARICVPNDYSMFQQYLLDNGCLQSETWFAPPDHLNYFTFKTLEALMAECGFKVEKMNADFPVEVFLLNEHSNYWADRSKGKQAYYAKIKIENMLMDMDMDAYIEYMAGAAGCGFGRSIIAFATVR